MKTPKTVQALGAGVISLLLFIALMAVDLYQPRQGRLLRDQFGIAYARESADLTTWKVWTAVLAFGVVASMLAAVVLWAQEADPAARRDRRVVAAVIALATTVAVTTIVLAPLMIAVSAVLGAAVVVAVVHVLGDMESTGGLILRWWDRGSRFPWRWYFIWVLAIGAPAAALTAFIGSYVPMVPSTTALTLLIVRWLGGRWRVHQDRRARAQPSPVHAPLRQLWMSDPLELMRHQASEAGDGVFLGTGGDHWEFSPPEHSVLVLGPPRSGKTSCIVIPSLLCHNGPAVSTSTKTDVLHATAGARADLRPPPSDPSVTPPEADYHGCYLFDPTGSVRSPGEGVKLLRWSPLAGCEDWLVARRRAASMAGAARDPGSNSGVRNQSHWTERATSLLAPLLHVAAVRGDSMAVVVDWVNSHDLEEPLEYLAEQPEGVNSLAMPVLLGMSRTDERELSGIWSTAAGVVACYQSDEALATTDDPNFDAGRWLHNNETIYIASSGEQQRLVAPIVVGLLDDLRRAVYLSQLDEAAQPARALFALDECANIAPIRELPVMASEAGGQGLTLLACFQDLSQIESGWPTQASGFLTLFNTNVVFRGIKENKTLELVSKLFGEHEVEKRSETTPDRNLIGNVLGAAAKQSPSHGSTTTSFNRERRVPFDEVARGIPGQIIVLNGPEAPIWITLTPAHGASPWVEITAGARPVAPLPDAWRFHVGAAIA